jgi:hypothetical protein
MLAIDNLTIEVTRQCNAICKHCLRGAAQSISVREEYIETLAQNVHHINMLNISGGEPGLAIKELDMIYHFFSEKFIPLFGFYLVTNGLNMHEFIPTLSKWYDYVANHTSSNKEPFFQVYISMDRWHPEVNGLSVMDMIAKYGWVYQGGATKKSLIIEGNAWDLWDEADEAIVPEQWNVPVQRQSLDEYEMIYGSFYLNSFGFAIDGTAWSYESQDSGKHTLGHIFDLCK